MTNVQPIYQRVEPEDLMTSGECARFLRRSIPTVRALTLRDWHPLPYINTGSGRKVQRVFHRPAVIRWVEEEIEMTRSAGASWHEQNWKRRRDGAEEGE